MCVCVGGNIDRLGRKLGLNDVFADCMQEDWINAW